MDAESKVMLVFVGFAILVGVICGGAGLESLQGLALALVFFYISYKAVPKALNLEESSFDAGAWNIVKTGVIPYWFLWLVFWTLVYTLRF